MASGWALGRRPALDGLRGVAIVLVLLFHALDASYGAPASRAFGSVGVTVFFTLSGFLITSLLVEEALDGRHVKLGAFYLRRAGRLLPAFLLLAVVLKVLELSVGRDLVSTVPALLYYANWAQVGGGNLGALTQAWSLSIEEQFYFVWPAVLVVSMRWRRGPEVVATTGLLASLSLRFALAVGPHAGDRVYYGSDTQAASLLVGVLLALLAHRSLRLPAVPRMAGMLTAAALLGVCLLPGWWARDVLAPTAASGLAAVLIWGACTTSGGPLTWCWLRYVGRRSYGLYLWHYPVVWFTRMIAGPSFAWAVVAVGLSFVAAEVSWRMVEHPVLQVATRRVPRRVREPVRPPHEVLATTGVAVGVG